jgi:hypothetical protein
MRLRGFRVAHMPLSPFPGLGWGVGHSMPCYTADSISPAGFLIDDE